MITGLLFITSLPYNGYLLFIYVNERLSPFLTYHMRNSNQHEPSQRVVQGISPQFSLVDNNALQGILLRNSHHREDITHKGLHLKILHLNNDPRKSSLVVTPLEALFHQGFLFDLL